jgi:hypothetical protein
VMLINIWEFFLRFMNITIYWITKQSWLMQFMWVMRNSIFSKNVEVRVTNERRWYHQNSHFVVFIIQIIFDCWLLIVNCWLLDWWLIVDCLLRSAGISHCPLSNFTLGSGVFQIWRPLKRDIKVGYTLVDYFKLPIFFHLNYFDSLKVLISNKIMRIGSFQRNLKSFKEQKFSVICMIENRNM